MAHAVLVVDDNEMNLRLITAVLKMRGYTLREARSGEEALAAIGAALPDLVLMDVQMPGLSGLVVARRLRAQPATAHLPIIAITAMAMKGDREAILEAGFDDYLAKPFHLKDVLALVAHWLPVPTE